MATFNVSSAGFAVAMSYSNGEIDYTNPLIANFLKALTIMDRHAAMEKLTFALDGSGPAYLLKLKAADGRVWKQWHTFASPTDADPETTFAVNDAWNPSEFRNHRAVRDAIIDFYTVLGMTDLTVTWT